MSNWKEISKLASEAVAHLSCSYEQKNIRPGHGDGTDVSYSTGSTIERSAPNSRHSPRIGRNCDIARARLVIPSLSKPTTSFQAFPSETSKFPEVCKNCPVLSNDLENYPTLLSLLKTL